MSQTLTFKDELQTITIEYHLKDADIHDFVALCTHLALAAGWTPQSVEEGFGLPSECTEDLQE